MNDLPDLILLQVQICKLDGKSRNGKNLTVSYWILSLFSKFSLVPPSSLSLPPSIVPDSVEQPLLLPEAVYEITEEQLLCGEQNGPPLLKIFLMDAEGLQQSGISLSLFSLP